MSAETAEQAITACETEAASCRLPCDDPSFWDRGEAWIMEQR